MYYYSAMLDSILGDALRMSWNGLIRPLPASVVRGLSKALFSKSWSRFQAATRDPLGAQTERLLAIVRRNRDTEFGKQHGFTSVGSIADYQRQVPVRSYEDFQAQILRMSHGEKNVLVANRVSYFAKTSGTTGVAKYIPVTEAFLEEYRSSRRVWTRQVALAFPGLVRGSMLAIHSPRIVEHTPSGIPIGSVSVAVSNQTAGAGAKLTSILKPLEQIPDQIHHLEDFQTRYYLLLRFAVVSRISLMAAINPSTLLLLCHKLTEFAPRLIADCERGGLDADLALSPQLRTALEARLRPDQQAARRLRTALAAHGRVRPIDLWPDLCGLLAWKAGSAPFYLRQFGDWFGDLRVMDYCYAATEGNFNVAMSPEGNHGVIATGGHFLEFVPEDDSLQSSPKALTADQLSIGKRYRMLVTASNGLYRYDINDVVEVVGRYGNTPRIAFCHKGGNMLSYTGEKIAESHVLEAVTRAQSDTGIRLAGFCLSVCLDRAQPRYQFAVETSETLVSAQLAALLSACEEGLRAANMEYAAKRDSLRLDPPELAVLRTGAFERWRRRRLEEGAFDAHVKLPLLTADSQLIETLGVQNRLLLEPRP